MSADTLYQHLTGEKPPRAKRGRNKSLGRTRQLVLTHAIALADANKDMNYADVMGATGLQYQSAHAIVKLMVDDGQLERITIRKRTIIKVLKNMDGSEYVPPIVRES